MLSIAMIGKIFRALTMTSWGKDRTFWISFFWTPQSQRKLWTMQPAEPWLWHIRLKMLHLECLNIVLSFEWSVSFEFLNQCFELAYRCRVVVVKPCSFLKCRQLGTWKFWPKNLLDTAYWNLSPWRDMSSPTPPSPCKLQVCKMESN